MMAFPADLHSLNPFDAPPSQPMRSPVEADLFRAAMRELAAGVTIIATGSGDGRRGLTATAVCSVSADPPTLLVCVNRSTEGHAAIAEAGIFSVNVTAAHHRPLADRFAGRHGVRGAERFEAGAWTVLETGAPILTDAVAAFDCVVARTVDWTTHTIYLGAVVAARVAPERAALLYRSGAFADLPAPAA
ncbi:flavin reductase family protein [Segnochrobactrum spirostomi]|nr:flavin reductase family protein [Segnochrobactrum spirostomi]